MGIAPSSSNHAAPSWTRSNALAQDLWSWTWSVIYGRNNNSNNPTTTTDGKGKKKRARWTLPLSSAPAASIPPPVAPSTMPDPVVAPTIPDPVALPLVARIAPDQRTQQQHLWTQQQQQQPNDNLTTLLRFADDGNSNCDNNKSTVDTISNNNPTSVCTNQKVFIKQPLQEEDPLLLGIGVSMEFEELQAPRCSNLGDWCIITPLVAKRESISRTPRVRTSRKGTG
eukprot:jgi/Psemu1/38171/gm1.38171_g